MVTYSKVQLRTRKERKGRIRTRRVRSRMIEEGPGQEEFREILEEKGIKKENTGRA